MLTLEGLRITLGTFTLRADWSVPKGVRIAVMGASGAGKSTLLLAIAGFTPPVSGRILWDGQDLTTVAAAQRPAAMLFQDQNLFGHLTLLQNAVLGLTAGRKPSSVQLDAARAALARVGLAGFEARKPAAVSGGQGARAALARMLLQARPLWLLDEPFAALDESLRREMLDLTGEVATQVGATVLMVTHQSQDAAHFAQMVVQVAGGVALPPVSIAEFMAVRA